MQYLEDSLALTGYSVSYQKLPAFDLTGFTKIVESGGEQYDAVRGDGRWEILRNIGDGDNTIYGVASLDEECPKGRYRYTVAVKAPADQFGDPCPYDDLFSIRIKESEWLVFELEHFAAQYGEFWQANPYTLIKKLGWDFDKDAGCHIDVYAPSYPTHGDSMEFWMPVRRHA